MRPSTWLPVLEQLASGIMISGSAFGSALGVSRAAVWQRVNYIKSLGVAVEATNLGYQLKYPVYLPNIERIQASFTMEVNLLPEVTSTNTLVLESRTERCLMTLYQSQGRGRRGRPWVGAPGYALMFSVGSWLDSGLQEFSGLSVDIGVAICNFLNTHGIPVYLKWPNDLWIGEAKLAGILTEMQGDQDRTFVVVGFGMNLEKPHGTDSSVACFHDHSESPWCDNQTIGLVTAILSTITKYTTSSSEERMCRYREVSLLERREVAVDDGGKKILGIAQGIDEFGRLLILTDRGVKYVSAGDVSVRPV